MPNENSFDPDICGSKRPTYPEKDRFEELYSKLAMNCFDEINDWEQTISEMREIYRALKQENKELKKSKERQFIVPNSLIKKVLEKNEEEE